MHMPQAKLATDDVFDEKELDEEWENATQRAMGRMKKSYDK